MSEEEKTTEEIQETDDQSEKKSEKMISQSEVNRIISAKAEKKARKRAEEMLDELLDEHGIDRDSLKDVAAKFSDVESNAMELKKLRRQYEKLQKDYEETLSDRNKLSADWQKEKEDGLITKLAIEKGVSNPRVVLAAVRYDYNGDIRDEEGNLNQDKLTKVIEKIVTDNSLLQPKGQPGSGSRTSSDMKREETKKKLGLNSSSDDRIAHFQRLIEGES